MAILLADLVLLELGLLENYINVPFEGLLQLISVFNVIVDHFFITLVNLGKIIIEIKINYFKTMFSEVHLLSLFDNVHNSPLGIEIHLSFDLLILGFQTIESIMSKPLRIIIVN